MEKLKWQHWALITLGVIIFILLYRYLFSTPKVHIVDIDSANKTVKYKVGMFGATQSISLSQIPQSGYVVNGSATKGYEQKIKNGILKIFYDPSENSIKIETMDKKDEVFLRWVMIYFNGSFWEDSERNHSNPK